MNQKRFATIGFLILIVVIAGAVEYFPFVRTPIGAPQPISTPNPLSNAIKSIRSVSLSAALGDKAGVEIEVWSSREFPIRNELAVLRIGSKKFMPGGYPENGDIHTLIFTLTSEEFANTATGDLVTVQYGRDDLPGDERWDFGPLDKSLSAKSLPPQGLYDSSDPSIAVVNAEDSGDVHLKNIYGKVLIGSPIANEFADIAYTNLVAKEFSAGQSLWYAVYDWQSENSYDFSDFNAVVNWLRQNGKSTHMHMLVGPNFDYMPEWLVNGTWTNEQLDTLLKNMIYSIMDANDNKNKVDVWNVINELFGDNDGSYVTNVIWNQLGWEADQSGLSAVDKINVQHPVFIRKAFQYARDKTNAKLEYRDYEIESNNPASGRDKKHKAVYQLLKHMLNSGIPIDAVGIQGHLDIGQVDRLIQNNELQNTVQKFKALGLEVYITEMDIGTAGQTWNDALAIQQKTDYYNYLRQAINGGVNRIYFWGVADGSDPGWRTDEHPLPWDENYKRKPAYYGIVRAFIGPTIKANGRTDSITVGASDAVTITVEMNASTYVGAPVDWWVVASANLSEWFYMNSAPQWTEAPFSGNNYTVFHPVHQGVLFDLPSTTVWPAMTLLPGTYYFWFAVDYPMDGILDPNGQILYDKVTVTVSATLTNSHALWGL